VRARGEGRASRKIVIEGWERVTKEISGKGSGEREGGKERGRKGRREGGREVPALQHSSTHPFLRPSLQIMSPKG
jgi:hypothetical protein